MLVVKNLLFGDEYEIFEKDDSEHSRAPDGSVVFRYGRYDDDPTYIIKHKSGNYSAIMLRVELSTPPLPGIGYVPCDEDLAREEEIAKRLEECEWRGKKMYKVERRFHPRTKLDYSGLPPDTIF